MQRYSCPVEFWFTFGLIFFYAAFANLFNIVCYGSIWFLALARQKPTRGWLARAE